MGDFVTVSNSEVVVAVFGVGEAVFNVGGYSGEAVGISGFDVDLLDLGGTGGFI